jgi:hypothetical protein
MIHTTFSRQVLLPLKPLLQPTFLERGLEKFILANNQVLTET